MSRIASLMKASALRLRFSLSLASRRQRLEAMVRSTTQRLGWTTKPFTRSDRLTISVSRATGQGAVKDRALIGAVGEQSPEKGKQTNKVASSARPPSRS